MKNILLSGVIGMTMFMGGASIAFAEIKPINQLPGDVARWSTLWTTVPLSMINVAQEHGPLAGVTWGPAKGTARFALATKAEVWDSVEPDSKRGNRSKDRWIVGPVFRYAF